MDVIQDLSSTGKLEKATWQQQHECNNTQPADRSMTPPSNYYVVAYNNIVASCRKKKLHISHNSMSAAK
jgi:hypothetical protein